MVRFRDAYEVDESGCWIWGRWCRGGYGMFNSGEKMVAAHRFAYERFVGSIPADHEIHHTCETKLCVNPAHLRVITRLEHKRHHGSYQSRKTHCKNGHPFDAENTRFTRAGKRACRTCARERNRRVRARP